MTKMRYADVVVVGGGPSGIMAAVAAARNGGRVILVERYGFLGGTITAGLVTLISSFFVWGKQIVGGIPYEMVDELRRMNGAQFPCLQRTMLSNYKCGVKIDWFDCEDVGTRIDPEMFKYVADRFCLDAGVELLFHSLAVNTELEQGQIKKVIIENKSGREAIATKIVIDTTGDADIAARSKVPHYKGRDNDGSVQPPSLVMKLRNVDYEKAQKHRKYFDDYVKEAVKRGELPFQCRNWVYYRGSLGTDEVTIMASKVFEIDGTNADHLSFAEIEARRQNMQFLSFFKKYVPGFKSAHLMYAASQIGVRETRRIVGEYTLTKRDVMEGREFEDTVARGYWPINLHNPDHVGSDDYLPSEGRVTNIPYRCLVPVKVDNLLVAGRCVSATREALSSIRICVTCMAMGEAAGTAAALCVKAGSMSRDLDVKLLQETLLRQGVILPREKVLPRRRVEERKTKNDRGEARNAGTKE